MRNLLTLTHYQCLSPISVTTTEPCLTLVSCPFVVSGAHCSVQFYHLLRRLQIIFIIIPNSSKPQCMNVKLCICIRNPISMHLSLSIFLLLVLFIRLCPAAFPEVRELMSLCLFVRQLALSSIRKDYGMWGSLVKESGGEGSVGGSWESLSLRCGVVKL